MSREPSFLSSLQHALRGLAEVARSERNFRIHLGFAGVAIALGVMFGISNTEWLFLATVIAAVLILEVLNAVVERLVDLVKPRLHPILHDVKDMMAGAVLLAAAASVVVGLVIFLPKLIAVLRAWGIILV